MREDAKATAAKKRAADRALDVGARQEAGGFVEEVEIRGHKLRFARSPARTATVTDLAYVDGMLVVAGMSNEEFSSHLRRIPFPFTGSVDENSVEIFHVSHGKWETAAPIRTFVPYEGGRSILASYTCTPLVHFSLDSMADTPPKVDAELVVSLS